MFYKIGKIGISANASFSKNGKFGDVPALKDIGSVLRQLQFNVLLIVCNLVETVLAYIESSVCSASIDLQDYFFGGGFEYLYRGMRFAISSAGTDLVVLVVFSPYKWLLTILSRSVHFFF